VYIKGQRFFPFFPLEIQGDRLFTMFSLALCSG